MKLPEDAGVEQAPTLAAALPASLAEAQSRAQSQAPSSSQSPVVWRIDASALKAFDSSTIALLLQAERLALKAGCQVEITGAPPQLSQLAKLYGVDALLPLADTASAAPAG